MQTLPLADPQWFTTFPHRVSPIADEWLPGLLLRCDEANDWSSGTTYRTLREQTQLERLGSGPQFMVMPALLLEPLAQLLLLPEPSLLATTYHAELARLYDTPHPYGRLLSPQDTFHVCPACVAHVRLLTRTLVWPSLRSCPLHQIELRNTCQCGAKLRLFSGKTAPFTCVACGRDWGNLPHCQISRTRARQERQLGDLYEYFLTSGTPRHLAYATEILRQQQKEKSGLSWRQHPKVIPYRKNFSLGYLVERLVAVGISLHDIRSYW